MYIYSEGLKNPARRYGFFPFFRGCILLVVIFHVKIDDSKFLLLLAVCTYIRMMKRLKRKFMLLIISINKVVIFNVKHVYSDKDSMK